jgi:hypothetical protein
MRGKHMINEKFVIHGYKGGLSTKEMLELNEKFPKGLTWKKSKDDDILIGVRNTKFKNYGEGVPSHEHKGVTYYPPTTFPTLEELEKDKDLDDFKVVLKLASGEIIKIIPAQAEPKKLFFGKLDVDEETENPFENMITQYGKLAYKVWLAYRNNEAIDKKEKMMLMRHALMRSYEVHPDSLPFLIQASDFDIERIVFAAMGVGDEVFEKKAIPESNISSQEETSTAQ